MRKVFVIPEKYGEKQLFRPGEIAEILNVSRSYAYQLIKDGDIKTPVTKPVRVPRQALVEYLAKLCPGWAIK